MTPDPQHDDRDRRLSWTMAVLIVTSPLLITLCSVLWRTPYPVNEAVALFEDVANRSPSQFLIPDTSYYRPLFHLTLMGIWHGVGSLEARLAWIKVVHIAPAMLLAIIFIWELRPRTLLDASAGAVSAAVLLGSPGFRDNLEIPLSYTAVAMPISWGVWMLLNREPSRTREAAILVLTTIAIGFKEQGLVLVPLIVAAWWTRAPGATRRLAVAIMAMAVAYVAFRLEWRGRWPLFEQSMGLGFSTIEPGDATVRFGAFPFWMYAYNSLCTISNVLFAEPSAGLFYITRNLRYGGIESWEVVHLGSSVALTSLIAWWGIRSLIGAAKGGWSMESRAFVAAIVALAACGALSFDYSRDRLGGMAVVFYALAAYFAIRAAAAQAASAPRPHFIVVGLALALMSGAWCLRAAGTVEWARRTSSKNEVGWLIQVAPRRIEFADRQTYLRIMDSMIEQGTVPSAPRQTNYPGWLARTFGPE